MRAQLRRVARACSRRQGAKSVKDVAAAIAAGEFANLLDGHLTSALSPPVGYTKHPTLPLAYRLGAAPPEQVDEMWRQAYIDVSSGPKGQTDLMDQRNALATGPAARACGAGVVIASLFKDGFQCRSQRLACLIGRRAHGRVCRRARALAGQAPADLPRAQRAVRYCASAVRPHCARRQHRRIPREEPPGVHVPSAAAGRGADVTGLSFSARSNPGADVAGLSFSARRTRSASANSRRAAT